MSIASIGISFTPALPFAFGGRVVLVTGVGCERADPNAAFTLPGFGTGGCHGRRGAVAPLEDAAVPNSCDKLAAGITTQPQSNGLSLSPEVPAPTWFWRSQHNRA